MLRQFLLPLLCFLLFSLHSASGLTKDDSFKHYNLMGYDFRYYHHNTGITFGNTYSVPAIWPYSGNLSVPLIFDVSRQFPVVDLSTRLISEKNQTIHPFIDIENSVAYTDRFFYGFSIGPGLQYRFCDTITLEVFSKVYWQTDPNLMGFYNRFNGITKPKSFYDSPMSNQFVTVDGNLGTVAGGLFIWRF